MDNNACMDEIKDRVQNLRRQLGLTQVELAKLVGVSQQSIQKLEAGFVTRPKFLLELATALGVEPEWLVKGDRQAFAPREIGYGISQNQLPQEPGAEFAPVQRVRLQLSAGVTGYSVDAEGENGKPIFFRRDFLASKGWRPDQLLALRVNGDSMEPGLWDKDMVVIHTADTEPRDGEVFAVNYEGEATIKRLKRDAGEWWLTSDNPDKTRYPDKRCHEGAIIIGKAVYKQSERI